MENKVRKRGGIIMKRKLRAAAVIVFAVVLFASMSLSVFADDWYNAIILFPSQGRDNETCSQFANCEYEKFPLLCENVLPPLAIHYM